MARHASCRHCAADRESRRDEAGMAIRLDLDAEDARMLLEALTIYLSDFRRQVAATENPDFRHTLQRKQNALEGLIEDLRRRSA
jgi:hypothetical protein